MLEALLRLKWYSFGEWVQSQKHNATLTNNELKELSENIKALQENFTP